MIPKTQWTIKPRTTRVIVFAFPDNTLTAEAAGWLYYRFPWKNVITVNVAGLLPARNRAVEKLILNAPPHFTDFILMDRDMRPNDLSDPLLTLPFDLACCKYNTGEHTDTHWHLPDAFHLGICRVRRKVFEKFGHVEAGKWVLHEPPFEMPANAGGTAFKYCECVDFHMKSARYGFTSGHGGFCQHKPSGSWSH